jgi:hypothetical protein
MRDGPQHYRLIAHFHFPEKKTTGLPSSQQEESLSALPVKYESFDGHFFERRHVGFNSRCSVIGVTVSNSSISDNGLGYGENDHEN